MLRGGSQPSPTEPEIKVNATLPAPEALGQGIIRAPQSSLNLKATYSLNLPPLCLLPKCPSQHTVRFMNDTESYFYEKKINKQVAFSKMKAWSMWA